MYIATVSFMIPKLLSLLFLPFHFVKVGDCMLILLRVARTYY